MHTIRDYQPSDEASWLRCRLLTFFGTDYYDDIVLARPTFERPAIRLVTHADEMIIRPDRRRGLRRGRHHQLHRHPSRPAAKRSGNGPAAGRDRASTRRRPYARCLDSRRRGGQSLVPSTRLHRGTALPARVQGCGGSGSRFRCARRTHRTDHGLHAGPDRRRGETPCHLQTGVRVPTVHQDPSTGSGNVSLRQAQGA